MNRSIDYIGASNYIDRLVKYHPKGWGAGFLCTCTTQKWRNGMKAARALALESTCPAMRIHGLWDDHHYFDINDIPVTVRQAEKVARVAKVYRDIDFYFSPWLEPSKASKTSMEACLKECRLVLPKRVKLVSGMLGVGAIQEVHHTPIVPTRPHIHSWDGEDLLTSPNRKFYNTTHANALFNFAWTWECNGLTGEDDHTPRRQREDWLRRKHWRLMKRAMR